MDKATFRASLQPGFRGRVVPRAAMRRHAARQRMTRGVMASSALSRIAQSPQRWSTGLLRLVSRSRWRSRLWPPLARPASQLPQAPRPPYREPGPGPGRTRPGRGTGTPSTGNGPGRPPSMRAAPARRPINDRSAGAGRPPLYRAMKPIANALAISMKNAETSGRMMKAWAQAPCSLVTAVMLAMAVGVAPRLMPVKPAEITAAS